MINKTKERAESEADVLIRTLKVAVSLNAWMLKENQLAQIENKKKLYHKLTGLEKFHQN